MTLEVEEVAGPEGVAQVRDLFREYGASIGVSLDFQDFDHELRSLPGEYASPRGALLLARVDTARAGCAGLRPLAATIAELKRLYVRPEFRGRGVGRRLTEEAIRLARSLRYDHLRLDTLPTMAAAIALYRSMGFVDIPAYRYNPVPGAVFLELRL